MRKIFHKIIVERDIFKQWFDLAYKQRLVLASTKGENGQMYVFTVDGLRLSFEQMLAEYPLDSDLAPENLNL